MLAAAADETYVALAALQGADDGSGELLFRHALGFFPLRAGFDVDGAVVAHAGQLGQLRLLVRVDVIDAQFRAEIVVAGRIDERAP